MPTTILRRFAAGALLGMVLLSNAPVRAQLTVGPQSVSVAVPQDQTITQTVTLTNAGSEPLGFCLSFNRPLQRAGGTARLAESAVGGTACGEYGEVLTLIGRDDLPGCCADTNGLAMTPEGRLFTSGYSDGRTIEFDAALNVVRSFAHPEVAQREPFPVTTGVAYNADTGTLWWLNIEAEGFTFHRALLLEGDLDGMATGRRIELPVAETAPPPRESGSPVGLAYDVATKHYYYVDFANDDLWAVDTLGTVVDGYPATLEAYPGIALGFGLDVHSTGGGDASAGAGLRVEVATNIPGQPGFRRIVTVDGFGGDTAPAPAEALVTPLPTPNPNAETGVMSGEPLRSVLDPNGVLYYPWSGFRESGIVAVRPHPLPPSWLVVEAWDGTLEAGESRDVELTFRPGTRAVGSYTAVLQAFTAATGEAVEVPLSLEVTGATNAEDDIAAPEASSLSVYPNPTSANTTIALTLDASADARVVVYDVLGRTVATLHAGELESGTHTFSLGARSLPAGVYLVRATGAGISAAQRVTIVR